jgi:hypothetical protein
VTGYTENTFKKHTKTQYKLSIVPTSTVKPPKEPDLKCPRRANAERFITEEPKHLTKVICDENCELNCKRFHDKTVNLFPKIIYTDVF